MVSSFTVVTRSRASAAQLFDVSLSIDEHIGSMEHSGERAIGGVTSGSIGLGETVTWRARHFGVMLTMTSKITALERPRRFVDEQVRGPFRTFHHEHVFEDAADGALGSVMTDTITLASPVFGRLAERAVLVPYLRWLIRRRNAHLLRAVGAASGTAPESADWSVDEASTHRRFEVSRRLGRGDRLWERAAHDILRWKVKTRSGFSVDSPGRVIPGALTTVSVRVAGVVVREPVEVVAVVDTPSRVGFSYRTRPGHPVDGEEAFIVHRDGDDVVLTIRSLTSASARQPWRAAYPLLRVAQTVARRRYLRALR